LDPKLGDARGRLIGRPRLVGVGLAYDFDFVLPALALQLPSPRWRGAGFQWQTAADGRESLTFHRPFTRIGMWRLRPSM
jgi:hypothetical protein